jgi:hypothetical protein
MNDKGNKYNISIVDEFIKERRNEARREILEYADEVSLTVAKKVPSRNH